MNVLLTGITGNLGFEIALSLSKRGVGVVPVVRDIFSLERLGLSTENVITLDLTKDNPKIDAGTIDCIVHCAGNVHFEKSGDSNSKMMRSVTMMAKDFGVPIYYVSTAFLWRESGSTEGLRNVYERDKSNSEKILKDSGVPYTIFRPSVLVGSTESGELVNWSGYYLLVAKFLEAAIFFRGTKIKFPVLTGSSNMIPVNQVAELISEDVFIGTLNELVYVTNPTPPKAQWVLDTTLEHFGVRDRFDFIDIDLADYGRLLSSKQEEVLYMAGGHFSPYWSLSYNFPNPVIKENLIDNDYLKKTLSSFQVANKINVV